MRDQWWLGDVPRVQRPGSSEGFYVFVGNTVQDMVVFLGFRDSNDPIGIRIEGTGFLLHHDGTGYLVTARHIAEKFEDSPFVIRANRHGGPAALLDIDNAKWHFPEEKEVDLAITAITVYAEVGNGPIYYPTTWGLNKAKLKDLSIGIGDICYTVGLFHFVAGHKRNLPVLYTGNIALMPPPDETIPVGNDKGGTDFVEAYLVESHAINGASGAPVFVRGSIILAGGDEPLRGEPTNANIAPPGTPIVPEFRLYLLGLFQAAWFLPPDDPLRKSVRTKRGDIVPVGLGVVVPAFKILDLLERDDVKNERKQKPMNTARMTSVSENDESDASSDDANPNHLADFTRLVDAAARKRPQGGQT